jgi:hypothetical protein
MPRGEGLLQFLYFRGNFSQRLARPIFTGDLPIVHLQNGRARALTRFSLSPDQLFAPARG